MKRRRRSWPSRTLGKLRQNAPRKPLHRFRLSRRYGASYLDLQPQRYEDVCFYDTVSKEGVAWGGPDGAARTLEAPPTIAMPWDAAMVESFPTASGEQRIEQNQAAS